MNLKERETFVELKTDIKYILKNLKEIKSEVKDHNDKLDNYNQQMMIIESNQKNHLKHHEFLEKQTSKMYAELSIFVSVLSILVGIILKFVFG